MDKIISELIKLNKKAIIKNEVPVSAIIVKNGRIISKGINNKNKKNSVINHAEIVAIRNASKKLGTWILDECDLYVTLEPCPMCKEVINQSRIRNVYYYLKNNKKTISKTNYIYTPKMYEEYFKNDLKYFFKLRR